MSETVRPSTMKNQISTPPKKETLKPSTVITIRTITTPTTLSASADRIFPAVIDALKIA